MSITAELPQARNDKGGRARPHARRRAAADPETERALVHWASKPRRAIDERLAQLESEWDVERAIGAAASTVALAGVLAGLAGRRRALVASAVALGFLVGSAAGAGHDSEALRIPGLRSRRAIEKEKHALRFLRGDFSALQRNSAAGAWF